MNIKKFFNKYYILFINWNIKELFTFYLNIMLIKLLNIKLSNAKFCPGGNRNDGIS